MSGDIGKDYQGRDRRRHKLYRTRNTEYHLRDGVVVAVRDNESRTFYPQHIALHKKLLGGVKLHPNGCVVPSLDDPKTGDAIYFSYTNAAGEERQIVTSRVLWIGRPKKHDVQGYLA